MLQKICLVFFRKTKTLFMAMFIQNEKNSSSNVKGGGTYSDHRHLNAQIVVMCHVRCLKLTPHDLHKEFYKNLFSAERVKRT
jgi:hypothetical protein